MPVGVLHLFIAPHQIPAHNFFFITVFAAAASVKPVGGHVLSHASAVRSEPNAGLRYDSPHTIRLAHTFFLDPATVHLRKGRGDERIAKLVDSPDCPEGEATYALHAGGWEGRFLLPLCVLCVPTCIRLTRCIPCFRCLNKWLCPAMSLTCSSSPSDDGVVPPPPPNFLKRPCHKHRHTSEATIRFPAPLFPYLISLIQLAG